MHALLISLVLFGQADVPIPPAPALAVPSPAATESVEDLKTWLLSRLIVDLSFDPQKSADVERMLDRMNERQLRALIAAYKERTTKQNPMTTLPREPSQQPALDQARLDKQQAEAYRDHLKREYDRRLLQGYMTQNLMQQSIVNNQRMMYLSNAPFGYSPLGYGGLGYGVMNYGGVGFGAPGFGGPYYGVGMQMW
jgi:hypothetical protein